MPRFISVGGASSSGTTLVADLLDSIPGMACPPELYVYSDPEAYDWSARFVAAALAHRPRSNPSPHGATHPWFNRKHLGHCGMDAGALDDLIRSSDSLDRFMTRFHERYETFRGRPIDVLAEKTPINVNTAEAWCGRFPNGLFVHVVRHPWSVIASLERRGFSRLQAANIWITQVQAGLRVRDHPNAVLLKYEDVLQAPFECMARIARRIQLHCTDDEVRSGFEKNEYRAGLPRVKAWSNAAFKGVVVPAVAPQRPAADLEHLLHALAAMNHAQDPPTGGGFIETAIAAGYEIDEPATEPPADLEAVYARHYGELLSRPRRGYLSKPVDTILRCGPGSVGSARIRTPSERDPGDLRVLHGVLGQAGQPQTLATALRRRGVVAASCSLADHGFDYPCDFRVDLERSKPGMMVPVLRRIARDYDVVHLHGSSFASPGGDFPLALDILLLRLLGTRVIWHARGTDSRLETEFRRVHPRQELYDPETFRGFQKPDDFRRRRVLLRESVCDAILAVDEEMRTYLPDAEIVPRAIDLEAWEPVGPVGDTPGRVVIVHAPSRAVYKGTEALNAAIERLRSEGLPIEYRLVRDTEHAEAKRIYATADIVVDQLMIGWYGVLAVEAMALGKPVISHIRPDLERFATDIPIVNANIDDVTDRLRELVLDEGRRHRLGHEGRRFVEERHCADKIAERLVEIYQRPRRPVEQLDWPELSSLVTALAKETVDPIRERNRELKQELGRLRKQLKAANERGARPKALEKRGLLESIRGFARWVRDG